MATRKTRNTKPETTATTTKPVTKPVTKPEPIDSVASVEAVLTEAGFTYKCSCHNSDPAKPDKFKTPYQVYAVAGPDANYAELLPFVVQQLRGCKPETRDYVLAMMQACYDGRDTLEVHRELTGHDGNEPFSHRVNEAWKRIQNDCKAGRNGVVHPVVFVMPAPRGTGRSNAASDESIDDAASKMSFARNHKTQHPSTQH